MPAKHLLFLFFFVAAIAPADEPSRPQEQCLNTRLVVRHYLSEFPELSRTALVQEPQKVVHPGDVLVVVLARDPKAKKDAWSIMEGGQPHAMIVARKDGELGHMNSPAFLANFIPEFKVGLSYVILRPKFTPELQARFGTQEKFEEHMNKYLLAIEKAGIVYDPLMQTDILSPGYASNLRRKIEKDCLKKGDVKPLYCSELPATVAALVEIAHPEGRTIESLFDEAIEFIRVESNPEDVEKNVMSAADEIVDNYLKEFRSRVEGLRTAIAIKQGKHGEAFRDGDPNASKADQKKLKELQAQIVLFEAARSSVHQVIRDKLAGRKSFANIAVLLKAKVIRPHDYLAEAQKAGYEIVGFYASDIPKSCYGPPPMPAIDPSRTSH